MNPELDTLATRLYVTIDDLLIDHPQWAPERPKVGIAPKLTDAELITLAVIPLCPTGLRLNTLKSCEAW